MPKGKSKPPSAMHPWYGREWLAYYDKQQVDLIKELGWGKARASDVITGKQRYNQEIIDDLAIYLNLRPYELLLSPDQAMELRRIRASAKKVAELAETFDALTPGRNSEPAPAKAPGVPERRRRANDR